MNSKIIKEKVFEEAGAKLLPRYFFMIISLFISALLYNFLLQPAKIVSGVIAGLAIINKHQNNGVLFNVKKKWSVKSHRGGILNASCWMKEVNLQRLQTT